ncbi:MAG: amino acid ABC transporter permease [Parvibaculaceae bacterium]
MLERLLNELPRFFEYYTLMLLLQGAAMTLLVTLVGCAAGFLFGTVIVFLRQTPGVLAFPLRLAAIAYVEIFRRVPFLVVLYLVLFFMQAITADASLLAIALVAICLFSTAYISEIIRGGLESVPRQQIEAASAMNFSRWQTLTQVVVPQAWPVILPPAVVFMVSFIKDSALVSQIGVMELAKVGKILNDRGLSALLVYGIIFLMYFLMSYPLARLGAWLETRLASPRSQRPEMLLRPA